MPGMVGGEHRRWLTRFWEIGLPWQIWIMLNPSTADADRDDPTIRKVTGFSKRLGAGGLIAVNLYTLRATDPRELVATLPGLRCDEGADLAIESALALASDAKRGVICAWGGNVVKMGEDGERRVAMVVRAAERRGVPLLSLKTSKITGQPGHPLYLNNWEVPEPWAPPVLNR